ncbi:hypothetical protein N8T08_004067 [Aspergillus melleus]|uniref:Uncharacterized protein n=1 Tax=Aspergillus melleus TaxID=138277 RepID=A0ACC3B4W9_9EURO|nr:hypothetical protein N8T08_004067 [Aspergillus melleus]
MGQTTRERTAFGADPGYRSAFHTISSTKLPTIVIAPGAWSLPPFYSQLEEQFTSKNLKTKIIPHVTTGAEPPNKTLDDDVCNLHNALAEISDAGEDIILVAHSYGGLVSSSAVKGLEKHVRQKNGQAGGVVMLVYMAAFVVAQGQSLVSTSGGLMMPWISSEGSRTFCALPASEAFHDLSPAEQTRWSSALTHTCLSVFFGKATHEPWNDLPTAYILCEDDTMLPLPVQEYMSSAIGTSRTLRLKASHHPYLSFPGKVVDYVAELVKEFE